MLQIKNVVFIGSPDQKVRGMGPVVKEALQDAVRFWHRTMLRRHFRTAAVGKYAYKRRARRWKEWKQKQKGHQRPIVYTGQTEKRATRGIKLTGTSKRGIGRFKVPGYVTMRRKNRDKPDLVAELTAVTRSEIATLARRIGNRVTKGLARKRRRKVVRL